MLLPYPTAHLPQGKATTSLVLPSLLQQPRVAWPWLGIAAGRGGGWIAFVEGMRLGQMRLVESVFEKVGWPCCSGNAYEVDRWRMSCCREWKTPFWGCSQLPTYQPGNATRFNFAYTVEKPWAGPRQVSVTRILSGWGFDAELLIWSGSLGMLFSTATCGQNAVPPASAGDWTCRVL